MDAASERILIALSPRAQAALDELQARGSTDKQARGLLKGIHQKFGLLRINPQCGDAIPRRLFPQAYAPFVTNLRRLELPQFWRMIYTFPQDQHPGTIQIAILEIFSHPDYDKLFGYRKK